MSYRRLAANQGNEDVPAGESPPRGVLRVVLALLVDLQLREQRRVTTSHTPHADCPGGLSAKVRVGSHPAGYDELQVVHSPMRRRVSEALPARPREPGEYALMGFHVIRGH